jgi:hypothetical protein
VDLEEAVSASRKGEARGVNHRGKQVAFAKGVGYDVSPRKRRKKNCSPHVTLYAERGKPGLDSVHVRLDKATEPTRRRINSLFWEPVEPLSVVDTLAGMFYRGRISR